MTKVMLPRRRKVSTAHYRCGHRRAKQSDGIDTAESQKRKSKALTNEPQDWEAPSGGQFPPPGQFPGQQPGQPGQQPPGQQFPGGGGQPPQQANYGAPTGQPHYQATAPPKKKKTWLWILLAVIGVAVLACGGCIYFGLRVAGAPIDATKDHVQLLQDGNYQAAYDSLCAETRSSISADEWIAQTKSEYPAGIDSFNFGLSDGVEIVNDVATVNGSVTSGGETLNKTFRVQAQDGLSDWQVCP